MNEPPVRPAIVKSADRVLDVLEQLAAAGAPQSFTQLAVALGVPKSSLSQLLGNLLHRGYIELLPNQAAYRIGPRLGELAQRATHGLPLKELAARVVRRLRDETNESVAFYIQDGDEVEVLVTSSANQSLVYTMREGNRAPLYSISPGKIVLASWPVARFESYLARIDLVPITAQTIRSKTALRREIARVRRDGFAYANEEREVGVRGLAVAVMRDGALAGALNVTMPVARYSPAVEAHAKRRLRAAADELSVA
jgi:DNA-binding IclR family transcriptional regulator